jgi:hypothetical protein
LFHEFFHGDHGAGLGASHQTGWTALVAKLLVPRRGEKLYDELLAAEPAPIQGPAGGGVDGQVGAHRRAVGSVRFAWDRGRPGRFRRTPGVAARSVVSRPAQQTGGRDGRGPREETTFPSDASLDYAAAMEGFPMATADLLSPPPSAPRRDPSPRLWTADEFERMRQLGVFAGRAVELVGGTVFARPPAAAAPVRVHTKGVLRARRRSPLSRPAGCS